jgi:hypothetical protein
MLSVEYMIYVIFTGIDGDVFSNGWMHTLAVIAGTMVH